MFSGLIAEVGTVEGVESTPAGASLRLSAELCDQIASGDSVCVNGVCLTASESSGGEFSAEVMNQTLSLSTLGELSAGARVNLELALRASDRLGGHLVLGHIDGTAEVLSAQEDGFSRRLRVAPPPRLLRWVIERGSIALDGVSLTVASLGPQSLEVALVPETLGRTTLGERRPGESLNVECDILGKYVERLMEPLAGAARSS